MPHPAGTLLRREGMRVLLASMFTAGITTLILAALTVIQGARLPYVFIIVWVSGVFGLHLHARLRRISMAADQPQPGTVSDNADRL